MTNRHFIHPATGFILFTVGVVLLSWVGTIYRWNGVNSMLGLENLRWLLRTFVHHFFNQPVLPYIFFLFFAAGLLVHSGLANGIVRLLRKGIRISRREKRALWLISFVAFIYVIWLLFMAFGPYNLLRSVVGTFEDSPLSQGLVLLIGTILSVVSVIYGFVTETYQTDRDIYRGMSYYLNCLGEFFVILFFISMFFMVFERSGFPAIMGMDSDTLELSSSFCSLLTVVYCVRHIQR